MKKINIFIAFMLLLCFIIPYNVKALDDPGFFNDCAYIPSKGYATQNNASHNTANLSHFEYITEEDTQNLYTPNAYIINNTNYRAMNLRNVYFNQEYGGSLQFDFYNHDLYVWGKRETDMLGQVSQGTIWQNNLRLEGYLILGSLKGSKFELKNDRGPSVGILTDRFDYDTKPYEMSNYRVNEHSFYTYNNGMTISVLHFILRVGTYNRQNKIVFNITNHTSTQEDLYVLGFALKPNALTTDSLSTESLGDDTPLDIFHKFRKEFEKTCYVGDLPEDMASPEVVECEGTIDCAIKKVTNTFEKWIHGLLEFLNNLFVPDKDRFSNMATDFMDWFDVKLGFLAQPITFTIDFLNRFTSLQDSGHYLIKVPDIKVPLFDTTIIHGFNYDLASSLDNANIKKVHDVTFVIINGLIVIAFLGLCAKKYVSIFGGSNEPTETLIESDGYSIDDKGEVHNSNTFRHVKSYKKSKITREWVKK